MSFFGGGKEKQPEKEEDDFPAGASHSTGPRKRIKLTSFMSLEEDIAAAESFLNHDVTQIFENPLEPDDAAPEETEPANPIENHQDYYIIEYLAGTSGVTDPLSLTAVGEEIGELKKNMMVYKTRVLAAVKDTTDHVEKLKKTIRHAKEIEEDFPAVHALVRKLTQLPSGRASEKGVNVVEKVKEALTQPAQNPVLLGEAQTLLLSIGVEIPQRTNISKFLIAWLTVNGGRVLRGKAPKDLDPSYVRSINPSEVFGNPDAVKTFGFPTTEEIEKSRPYIEVDDDEAAENVVPAAYRQEGRYLEWLEEREETVREVSDALKSELKEVKIRFQILCSRRKDYFSNQGALTNRMNFPSSSSIPFHPSVFSAMNDAVSSLEEGNDSYIGVQPSAFFSATATPRRHFLRLVSLYLLKYHVRYPKVYRQTRVLSNIDQDIFREKIFLAGWRHVNNRIISV